MVFDITKYSDVDIVYLLLKIIKDRFSKDHPQFRFLNDENIKDNLNTYFEKYINHLQSVKMGTAKDLLGDNIPLSIKPGVLLLKLLKDQDPKSAVSYKNFYRINNFYFKIEYEENMKKEWRRYLILDDLFLKNIYYENEFDSVLKSVKFNNKKAETIKKTKTLYFSEDSSELIADNMSPEEIEVACENSPWDIDKPFTKPNNSFLGKLPSTKSFENPHELYQMNEQQRSHDFSDNKGEDQNTFIQSSKKPKELTNLFNKSMDTNEFKKAMSLSIKLKPKRNSKIISFENEINVNKFENKNDINFGDQQFILLAPKYPAEQNKKKLPVIKEGEVLEFKELN